MPATPARWSQRVRFSLSEISVSVEGVSTVDTQKYEPKEAEPPKTQATLLVNLVGPMQLFRTPGGVDSEAYATMQVNDHFETWSISSKRFNRYLSWLFYKEYGKTPGSQSLQDAWARSPAMLCTRDRRSPSTPASPSTRGGFTWTSLMSGGGWWRNLFLDAEPPCILVKGAGTKNRKDARQYVTPELAAELKAHAAKKMPTAPVFAMPGEYELAPMLRADTADARRRWLEAAKDDPEEYQRRHQLDFLADVDHEGRRLDFHCLRYTCGAWLAMAGAHPKAVQTVMRHSTITLTMDTYGHLFPGQEAETVARFLPCSASVRCPIGPPGRSMRGPPLPTK